MAALVVGMTGPGFVANGAAWLSESQCRTAYVPGAPGDLTVSARASPPALRLHLPPSLLHLSLRSTMATLNQPTPGSKNPFITPPMTNNPFLRRHEPSPMTTPQLSSPMPSASAAEISQPPITFPREPANIAIPVSPTLPPPEPSRSAEPGRDNATSDEPVSNPPFLSEDEAIEAAIQASLSLQDNNNPAGTAPPPSGPPPPLPPRTTTLQTPPPDFPARRSFDASGSITPPRSTSAYPTSPFEEPPPYTAGPDAMLGEATIEVGPARPFQNAARRAPPPSNQGWSGYPGTVGRQQTGAPYLSPQGTGWGGSTSQPDLSIPGGYAPPPGPPPPRSGGGASSSGPSATPAAASDGTPTVQPMPGRPFLHDGQTLVYPQGYLCHKCEYIHPT